MNSPVPPEKNISTQTDVPKGAEGKSPSYTTRSPSIYTNFRLWGIVGFIVFFLIPYGYYRGPVALGFGAIVLAEVVLLFNILIIVHELGHFLAAKWCGLKIEKFAIWFGKPLWTRKIDGVEYILGSIPGGGYVALPQMAPMEALEGKSETPREELPPASPWQKIIVAFAGPLFSFGLALFFACIVWLVGKPVSTSEATHIIGTVAPNYPAAKAGLLPGDKIVSINGQPISSFMGGTKSVVWLIATSTTETFPIVVQRGSETLTFPVTPAVDPIVVHHWYDRAMPHRIGIGPADGLVIIKKLYDDSPALAAGMKPGDLITRINGQPFYSTGQIEALLLVHAFDPIQLDVMRGGDFKTVPAGEVKPDDLIVKVNDEPIYGAVATATILKEHNAPTDQFEVVRGGTAVTLKVLPEKPLTPTDIPKDQPQTTIGIKEFDDDKNINIIYPTPIDQVQQSVKAVTGTIAALITPHSNINASDLSGPVGIMNLFSAVLNSPYGWRLALWLAVLINVNLAMLNLFPLPVLDGGHITLSLIEWVRRRPLSMSLLEPLQTACALALICFMVYVSFYDVQDSGRMAMGAEQVKFAHKAPSP